MLKAILKLFQIIGKKYQTKLLFIIGLSALAGLFEMITLSAMLPFVMSLSDPQIISKSYVVIKMKEFFHVDTFTETSIMLGLMTIIILFVGNVFAAFSATLQLRFSHFQGHYLSCRLLYMYLEQPYEFFISKNTNTLSKNVLSEVGRVILGVLLPSLQLVTKAVGVMAIIFVLVLKEPLISLSMISILGGIYFLIYLFMRKNLNLLGKKHSLYNQQRYKIVNELFLGIKAFKLNPNAKYLAEKYHSPSEGVASCDIKSQLIPQITRYALESLVYSGIITLALFLILREGGLQSTLPILAMFAFAGYRLMPALQQMFSCATTIQYHLKAIDLIHDCLNQLPTQEKHEPRFFRFKSIDSLRLKDVSYIYPNTNRPILKSINLTLNQGDCIGIVGATGAGKTTLIDILLGLLECSSGNLFVNNSPLNIAKGEWNKLIGYVPQDIFLADCSILENIAFGLSIDKIDYHAAREAAKLAQIDEFIMQLPNQYQTLVGERGIRFSGGQRQRIGIARALYGDPKLLVLDEATSALDSKTEIDFLRSLKQVSKNMIVIMIAHRLASIKHCDKILYLCDGKLVASGSFQELQLSLPEFNELTKQQATQ